MVRFGLRRINGVIDMHPQSDGYWVKHHEVSGYIKSASSIIERSKTMIDDLTARCSELESRLSEAQIRECERNSNAVSAVRNDPSKLIHMASAHERWYAPGLSSACGHAHVNRGGVMTTDATKVTCRACERTNEFASSIRDDMAGLISELVRSFHSERGDKGDVSQ